jgi:hypothetical protein
MGQVCTRENLIFVAILQNVMAVKILAASPLLLIVFYAYV